MVDFRRFARKADAELRHWTRDIWYSGVAGSSLIPSQFRYLVYRCMGMSIERSRVSSHCRLGPNVRIGRGTFINQWVYIDDCAAVIVGRKCFLGMGVTITTASHEMDSPEQRAGAISALGVEIGDGCWLGANATVLSGVTIGPGTVIGAGSVVTGDCAPNSVYVGVPARFLRKLE